MKLLLISDIHLLWDNPIARLDDAPVIQRGKLEFVLDYARKNDMVILAAGDFFDRPRSWMLLPVIIDLLKRYGVPIYCVYGQHDVYMYSQETKQNTSLGILEKAGLVNILDGSIHMGRDPIVSIYGCSFGQEVPEIVSDGLNILVIHAPIAENALFVGHDYIGAKAFLKKHKDYDLILCGDIHRFFCIEEEGRFILNTGPLLRREATEYNFSHKPGFFAFDTDRIEEKLDWIEIPYRSADEVLSRDHIERPGETNEMLDSFIGAISEDFEADVDFVENLWRFTKENKIGSDVVDILSEIINKEGERKDGEL